MRAPCWKFVHSSKLRAETSRFDEVRQGEYEPSSARKPAPPYGCRSTETQACSSNTDPTPPHLFARACRERDSCSTEDGFRGFLILFRFCFSQGTWLPLNFGFCVAVPPCSCTESGSMPRSDGFYILHHKPLWRRGAALGLDLRVHNLDVRTILPDLR